jgi:hypothetical protein
MMEEDKLFKDSLNREFTSTAKRWSEEQLANPDNIRFENVWIDTIPSLPPNISTSAIEIISDLTLTEDRTVSDQKTWLVCKNVGFVNTREGDFISPDKRLSPKYSVRIFDNAGTAVILGEEEEWYFDYKDGILAFKESPIVKYHPPFHLFGYRYIGKRGTLADLSISVGAIGLNASYNGAEGDGAGRVIYTDNGPVELKASAGYAPLQIDPISYTPTLGLSEGQICLKGGIIYVYDDSRHSWVSMQRQAITFGAKRADGIYMNLTDFTSNASGWPALRDGVILGITAQASGGYPSKKISILFNEEHKIDFNLSNRIYINSNLNIPFNGGDLIKMLVGSEFETTYGLVVNLELGWRI